MLDGFWQVHWPDGRFIGFFETRMGNDVMFIPKKAVEEFRVGTIFHMDEVYSKKAWEVKVTGNYKNRPTEITIEKIRDRDTRYPERQTKIVVREYHAPIIKKIKKFFRFS